MRALTIAADEQMMIEAAQRDPSRFAELYERHFTRIYAYLMRRVGDRDEAEDLTSEVFHRALANLPRYEWRGTPFVAWLLRIAANVLNDRWEKNGKRREVSPDDVEEPGAVDGTERRAILFDLVGSLPEDQQLVLYRRFVDQRSIRDIAHEMKRSEGAVKQLQFRALQTLRERTRSQHD